MYMLSEQLLQMPELSKLCSNSSDELQFQAFITLYSKNTPWSKIVFDDDDVQICKARPK